VIVPVLMAGKPLASVRSPGAVLAFVAASAKGGWKAKLWMIVDYCAKL
jgi:hypothetical protein